MRQFTTRHTNDDLLHALDSSERQQLIESNNLTTPFHHGIIHEPMTKKARESFLKDKREADQGFSNKVIAHILS